MNDLKELATAVLQPTTRTSSQRDFNSSRDIADPKIKPLSFEQLTERGKSLTGNSATFGLRPQLDLSAIIPCMTTGWMDLFEPGRYDCTYNYIHMNPIVQVGPTPTSWQGSVAYVHFKIPFDSAYLVVANFSGWQSTMFMYGPWGTAKAFTATTSDSGAVMGLYTGKAGTNLYFSIDCQAPSATYLMGVQVIPYSV